jgi:hypothetical protein
MPASQNRGLPHPQYWAGPRWGGLSCTRGGICMHSSTMHSQSITAQAITGGCIPQPYFRKVNRPLGFGHQNHGFARIYLLLVKEGCRLCHNLAALPFIFWVLRGSLLGYQGTSVPLLSRLFGFLLLLRALPGLMAPAAAGPTWPRLQRNKITITASFSCNFISFFPLSRTHHPYPCLCYHEGSIRGCHLHGRRRQG